MRKFPIFLSAALLAWCCTGCGTPDTGSEPDISAAADSANDSGTSQSSTFTALHSFNANTLGGGTFTASDLADADVNIIHIWSTTCPPCIEEMPQVAAFAAGLPENVRLITWCLDAEYSQAADRIPAFLEQSGYSGITLTSGDGDLNTLYGELMYTPTTLFYDKNGDLAGEAVIGAGSITQRYTEQINAALAAQGLDPLPAEP